jgi:hypothetical protein
MRKLKTKEQIEKKKKRDQALIGIFITSLLLFSTLGYSLMSSDEETLQGDQGFISQNGLWVTQIQDQTYGFQFLPSEVKNISVNGTYDIGEYYQKPLYFVGNSEATSEILNNLGRYILRTQEACLGKCPDNNDLPSKNCSQSNIIIFQQGEDRVYKQEKCVYISGNQIKSADAFLYKVLMINGN